MKKIDKIKLWVFIIIRASVLIAGVLALFARDWQYLGMSLLAMAAMFVPSMVEKRMKLDFPSEFDIIVVVFIYAAIFLGEANFFYDRFRWWDIMLHGFSGLIIGNIGFSLVDYLNRSEKVSINLSPSFVALFSFCFALAIGAVWEIYEFLMDTFFGFNMQRNSLDNTMIDLIMDSAGAAVFSILGYLHLKGKIRVISRFKAKIQDE